MDGQSPTTGLTFGARLRKLRRLLRWRLADMAPELGVSPEALSQYERDVAEPKGKVIIRLLDALGVPLEVFTKDEPDWQVAERRMWEKQIARMRVNQFTSFRGSFA